MSSENMGHTLTEECSQPSLLSKQAKGYLSPLQPNFLSPPEAAKSVYLIRKEEGEAWEQPRMWNVR